MNKEFMIWYYNLHKPYITYEALLEKFKERADSVLESLSPFFVVDKNNGVTLHSKYGIGILSIKRTIAFLLVIDGKDIAIDLLELNGAMDQDLVVVNQYSHDPFVVDVIKSNITQVIANVKKSEKHIRFDAIQAKDKLIVVENIPSYLVDGHVVVLMVNEVTKTKIHTTFVEVIGHKNDPDMEIVKIIYEYQWPISFSKETLNEVQQIKVDDIYESKTRTDLTNELIITIDGADAKDLDDAIHLVVLPNNQYKLGVHIADVAYFVKEGMLLDEEAYKRSTSVYLADRVIPMIPHALSNDLCSLNPNEIKYTLTCEMILDADIEVIDYKIFASKIKSKQRLTYQAVNQLFKTNQTVGNKDIDDMLFSMNEIAKKLKIKRSKRGAIDFESSELKFKLDLEGHVLSVEERRTDEAEMLIESFMILANETVAKHFHNNDFPGIYRVHEKPDIDKLETALLTVKRLGFHADKNAKSTAKILQRLTNDSTATKYQYIIHMILLRSMQKAKYSPSPIGHFGLASPYYSHFTSPIRRYPDLLLHRMIRDLMLSHLDDITLQKRKAHYKDIMHEYTEQTSKNERIAINIERDVVKLKSCEYMKPFIGKSFEASIVQMMPSGFFVKLDSGIEGFVNVRNVNQYLIYDEENLLFFTDRGKRYRLGDSIIVKLIDIDMVDYRIDFTIGINDKKNNQQNTSKKKDVVKDLNRSKKHFSARLKKKKKS